MRKIVRKTGINKCCVASTKSCNRVEKNPPSVYIATLRHKYSKRKNTMTLQELKNKISASGDVEGAWPNSGIYPFASTKNSIVANLAYSSGTSSHLEKLILCFWDMRDSNLFFFFSLLLDPEDGSYMIYKPRHLFFFTFLSGYKSSLTTRSVLFKKQ